MGWHVLEHLRVEIGVRGRRGAAGRPAGSAAPTAGRRSPLGGVLTPTVEAGLRYDIGDAETGAGLEVGGGLGYAARRLSVTVNARGLLAHQDTAYEEWGFSGAMAYTPSADGRGLSMRLGSGWGATHSGVESLWSRQNAAAVKAVVVLGIASVVVWNARRQPERR